MKHLNDNFKPGAPISAVGVEWFNTVARFVNNLIGKNGVIINKESDYPTIEFDPKSAYMGTPTDNTEVSEGASEASSLTFTDWTADGENGVKLRLYALVEEDGSEHVFQPVDIEIAANGMVKSVKAPSGNLGIWIGA